MQFTLLTTVAALAFGTHAAVIGRQGSDNPRLAQFRVFSDYGCSNLNEGFFTVDTDQSNKCNNFAPYSGSTPNGYVSIVLQALQPAGEKCKLYLYSDTTCSATETEAALNGCDNASVTQDGASFPTWNSWQLKC
ncbi:hypothetical protein JX265_012277 [Neoarthrinium moseri]|uniref:Uncharacterized protein n=1 Tax=Neoarthrinium moseri TaxID=1658444 RepID=A0A9P9WB11_9PEZI|nr:hypothetical protein JX265_012277 [Neoarthrinium moseri]